MTKAKGYTQADLDVVSESHEWTAEDFARARPAKEVLSAKFFESLERQRVRGPQKTPTKKLVSIRLDPEVVKKFRATGRGWQGRMNEVLRKAVGL